MAKRRSVTNRPKKGTVINYHGKLYKIYRVYPFGTVDVWDEKGNLFRITGLNFL